MAARSAAWSWFMCVMVLAFCTGSISRALPAGETCWARGVEGDERETERVVTMLGDRGTYGTRQRGSDLLQCFHRFGLLSVRSKVLNSEFVYSIDLGVTLNIGGKVIPARPLSQARAVEGTPG